MLDISFAHAPDLSHHLKQGSAWLVESDAGEKTTALSYAALEFRYQIERLTVHYWVDLLGENRTSSDLKDIESFSKLEAKVRELGGHQLQVNGHFEFMRVVFRILKIDWNLRTPNVGQLRKHWHTCSGLCHIGWPLSSGALIVRQSAYASLVSVRDALAEQLSGLCSWPSIKDPAFEELRQRFLSGRASPADVQSYLQASGIWARVEYPDGRPSQFVGESVPPTSQQDPT
jgi:hypothetical protein